MSIDNMFKGLRRSVIGLGLVAAVVGCGNKAPPLCPKGTKVVEEGGFVFCRSPTLITKSYSNPADSRTSSTPQWTPIFYQDSSEATPCTLTAKARNPNTKEAIDLVFPNLKIGLNPVKQGYFYATSDTNFLETTTYERISLENIHAIHSHGSSMYTLDTRHGIYNVSLNPFIFVGVYHAQNNPRTLTWDDIIGDVKIDCTPQ